MQLLFSCHEWTDLSTQGHIAGNWPGCMWAQLHTTRCSRWTWAHRTSAPAFLANRTCCLYAYASPHVLQALPGSSVTTPWPTPAPAVSFLSVDSWLPSGVCSCCSVVKSCPALWDPMDCSTPGFSVLHYLLEFAQIHVHWASDAV